MPYKTRAFPKLSCQVLFLLARNFRVCFSFRVIPVIFTLWMSSFLILVLNHRSLIFPGLFSIGTFFECYYLPNRRLFLGFVSILCRFPILIEPVRWLYIVSWGLELLEKEVAYIIYRQVEHGPGYTRIIMTSYNLAVSTVTRFLIHSIR